MESRRGKLYVVGLGPGDPARMTAQARAALAESEVIVGYRSYVTLIEPALLEGKEVVSTGMQQEIARVRSAIEIAAIGRAVSLVSSGDPGVYGMAGLVYELLKEAGWSPVSGIAVEVVPGVSALNAAAALLGAPLMHDFAAISLSDLLTPWEKITARLEMAAIADFVIALYNPRSKTRVEGFTEAVNILLRFRAPETPVGVVRAAGRKDQSVVVTDLAHLVDADVDMQTTVIVGNSSSFSFEGLIVTPRGYASRYDLSRGQVSGGEGE